MNLRHHLRGCRNRHLSWSLLLPMRPSIASFRASPSRRRSTPPRRATRSSSSRGRIRDSPPAWSREVLLRPSHHQTDNLRLIGKVNPGQGDAGKVRLVYDAPVDPYDNVRAADVGAGVYAAPDVRLPGDPRSCDPDVSADSDLGQAERERRLSRASTFAASPWRGSRATGSRPAGWMASSSSGTNPSTTSTTASIRPSRRTDWSRTTSPTARSIPRCGWRAPRTFA